MAELSRAPGARPKRRVRRTFLIAVAAVVLLVGGAASFYAWSLSNAFDSQTVKIQDVFPDEASRPAAAPADSASGQSTSGQNILMLGSDTRGVNDGSIADLTGQRSDSIMVVHVPANGKNLYVMSIMRDSWLEIPGRGEAKINAAMSYGGVPLAVQTVEGLLGARIDHVAIVDFTGFKGITDALGGVDVESPIGFDSSHLKGHYFAEGTHRLNGTEALAFVRERYAFSDGDFQRARNQQAFIKAILGKSLTAETLTNPGKISDLVGAVAPYLAVDDGLNAAYVAGLAVELRDVRVGNVLFFALPTTGTGTSPDGQSIVVIDQDKLKAVQQSFQTDTLDTYQPEAQTIG
ncbi:LytR family transcriptional regulator [Cryobacterium sp. TMT1-21]|uniref:LCP family protein n=1 Tax=Cryobacterium sp. TMT1-21 TaxID=1259234 RepID=UPI00106C30CA|nr:LCP family protein [Cryobacterium sp. TMT1-21]TFD17278.1 LytR family transcriptional regulator [Cryobacterium sp. TMT1-21]